jgi:F-type H+-transporting ATPase subunit a
MFSLYSQAQLRRKKNNGIASGVGRIFEPVVLYVRDEIAIPNIERSTDT